MWAALLEEIGWRAVQPAVRSLQKRMISSAGQRGPGAIPQPANYAANEPSRDWLDAERMSAASNASANNSTSNNTTNETAIIPYQISQTFRPIHEIDSSFNQSIQAPELPQPDKQGLINGIPAEIYYAIGPAYFGL